MKGGITAKVNNFGIGSGADGRDEELWDSIARAS